MDLRRRQFMSLAAGAAVLPATVRIGAAEAWPARSIRAFVTAGAGSAVDVVPRVVFDQLAIQLGQPIVVENRGGAGGTIAVTMVARAPPDGYTILAASSALTVAPWLHPSLAYDTSRDLAAIAALGSIPNVLVTSPANGSKTVAQFIAAARAKPGSFNYASTGVGTATHMSAERFRVSAGIEAVHVPTKSGPEALTEVLSGRADFYLCPLATALPFIRDGKVLGLAVSGTKRRPELPDVPTTLEAGLADADYTFWLGLFAPRRTARDIVQRLHDETVKAMSLPAVAEKLATLGVAPMPMAPEAFDTLVKNEIASNALLVKAAGIRPD
jgi:tripartite-type tricarboxylate transporter receptor subunit TctC